MTDHRMAHIAQRLRPAFVIGMSFFFIPAGFALDHGHHAHMQMMDRQGYVRTEQSYRIPDVSLVAMDGTKIALADALDADKPIMLNFIYSTCTTICPVMSATFSQVQEQLGPERDQVRMVSITIDPEHDVPAKLREYAGKHKADANWQFLTGTRNDIVAAQKAFDVFRGDKSNHIPVTFMRTGANAPWVRLEGLMRAADLVNEYRQLAAR